VAAGAEDLRAGVLAANGPGREFWSTAGARDFSITVTLPTRAQGDEST
jgi:hypothetical protein